jgi:hypothetical protein
MFSAEDAAEASIYEDDTGHNEAKIIPVRSTSYSTPHKLDRRRSNQTIHSIALHTNHSLTDS